MARILHAANGRWYDELRTIAFYSEAELERKILQHANAVFRGYHVFPFKLDVRGRTAGSVKRPDLALIRKDFAAWALVEVELKAHTLTHVLEQTGVFVDGDYNALELSEYAKAQLKKVCNKTVSIARLLKLFSENAPSILVVADEHQPTWKTALGKSGIRYGVFEVYKSVAGHFLYRTLGEYPVVPADEAHVKRHVSMPNLYEVIGEFSFTNLTGGHVEIALDEYLTRWALVEDGGKVYLRFIGSSNPLSPDATYGLIRDKFDRYHLKRN